MRAVGVALILVIGLPSAGARAADAPRFDPGPAIVDAVEQHFGHWDGNRRASFARALAAYRSAAAGGAGRDQIDLAAMRLVASLRNAHSVYSDDAFVRTRPWNAPFELQFVDGGWVVTESRTPNVRDGARLVSVDGVPAAAYFGAHRDLLAASSEREARTEMLTAMYDATPAHGTARLRFDDGATIALDSASSASAGRVPRVSSRWLVPQRIAYVAVPSFGDANLEKAAVATIRSAWPSEAIVLDVRGNDGGTTPVSLLWLFADRHLPWWRETSTAPKPARALSKPNAVLPINPSAYRGRVVVLADERCVSSCEDLVMPLVIAHRARFVGARTAGSTGMPFSTMLADGVSLRIGSVRASFPDGKPFEGVGIAPTDPIPLTVGDLRAHRDVQLSRALAIAENGR